MTDLLEINVKFSESEFYKKNLGEELRVNKNNIDQDLLEQASKFAWWATLAELAKDKAAKCKRDLEIAEARIKQVIRAENSKLTENDLKERLLLTPEWQAAKNEYLEAEKQSGVLDVAQKSFDQRKYMLSAYASSNKANKTMDIELLKMVVKDVIKEHGGR